MRARRAAGAVVDAVRAVAAGQTERAFCAVRPPGHHAGADDGDGVLHLLHTSPSPPARRKARAWSASPSSTSTSTTATGIGKRWSRPIRASSFASIHRSRPPGLGYTGDASETGVGNVVNATVEPHAPRERWRAAFEGLMAPLDAFAPDLILSPTAGFDAHARDPLADQGLEASDFAWATRAIAAVARARCGGRIVSSLEGGYDLEALGQSALAHVRALEEG